MTDKEREEFEEIYSEKVKVVLDSRSSEIAFGIAKKLLDNNMKEFVRFLEDSIEGYAFRITPKLEMQILGDHNEN